MEKKERSKIESVLLLILRILATPFLLVILLLSYNYHALRRAWLFICYGGEWITYENNQERHTILEIYNLLKDAKVKEVIIKENK